MADLLFHGYNLTLAALTLGLMLQGTGPMRRTILTIFAVFCTAWLLKGGWPSTHYALEMIAVDSAALVVICARPAGKWQSIIGLSFILQVATHIGRIISGADADINSYWGGLSAIAVLQLLLVGGWWLHEYLVLPRRTWRRSPYQAAADPGR